MMSDVLRVSVSIKRPHFNSGEREKKKEEMAEIKKVLPSDLKITLVQLQQ